jgi:hypothetical protein
MLGERYGYFAAAIYAQGKGTLYEHLRGSKFEGWLKVKGRMFLHLETPINKGLRRR